MKNVPVPVYCRPLVEKDPNRKVEASLCAVGSGSNSRVGFLSWMFVPLMHVCVFPAVVCSWGRPDRVEGWHPRLGPEQSTFQQQRPPERRGRWPRQEEQPELAREEEGGVNTDVCVFWRFTGCRVNTSQPLFLSLPLSSPKSCRKQIP